MLSTLDGIFNEVIHLISRLNRKFELKRGYFRELANKFPLIQERRLASRVSNLSEPERRRRSLPSERRVSIVVSPHVLAEEISLVQR